MGFFDFLFGKKKSQTTTSRTTLKKSMNRLDRLSDPDKKWKAIVLKQIEEKKAKNSILVNICLVDYVLQK